MSWFRIHGKAYLLSEEKRQGPLIPRTMADWVDPSTTPMQSLSPMKQAAMPIPQPLQIIPGAYPSPYMYPNSYMFPFPSPMPG
ncbi:hypothetical protein Gotur_006618 [Gossypium turneri]